MDKLLYNFVYSPELLPLRCSLSFRYRTGAILFTHTSYVQYNVTSEILNIFKATNLMLVVHGLHPIIYLKFSSLMLQFLDWKKVIKHDSLNKLVILGKRILHKNLTNIYTLHFNSLQCLLNPKNRVNYSFKHFSSE